MSSRTLWKDIREQPQALAVTLDRLFGTSAPALEQARATLRAARGIVVTGMGASYLATLPFQHALAGTGMSITCIEAGELLYNGLELCRGKVVVIVSRSGEGVEIVKLLDALKPFDTLTIGISNESQSTLMARAHQAIFLGCPPDKMVAIQTYSATVAAMLALAGGLGVPGLLHSADFQPAIAAVEQSIAMVEATTMDVGAALAACRPTYLLGRGSAYGTALEGQLMIQEAARFPAVAMTGHGFRHGPFEIVEAGFGALVLTQPGPLDALNRALIRDIRAVGGKAWLTGIGGDVPVAPHPAALAPLVDIIPLQVIAARIADARGVVPGDFRHSALVTTREDGFSI